MLGVCAATAFAMGVAGPAAADNAVQAASPGHVLPSGAKAVSGNAQSITSSTVPATVRYAVPKRDCAAATSTQVSCMAVRLVPAVKATKGAKAYVAAARVLGPAGGYTPADLASAYGYNRSLGGTNQTVGIVDAFDDPNALRDLNSFDSNYGLPQETSASFRKVNQDGSTAPLPAADAGWAGEIALDVETVRAVCAHCKILLVEARQPTFLDLAVAVNTAARLGATEISNSYGAPEDRTTPASVLAAYNHPGVVITASTGDDGWYDWDLVNQGGSSGNAPNTPAAFPSVVAVGGTALTLNSDGSRLAETVWNENGPEDQSTAIGASGGGCSAVYAAPSWQAQAANYAKTGCGAKRQTGDIAAVADPFTGFDTYNTYGNPGWATFGGTSLSSPLIAAMWALAGGSGGVAYPAQSLYHNLPLDQSAVFDVSTGSNAFCGGVPQATCSADLSASTGTGNPNNLNSLSGSPLGLLDCGFPLDGSAGIIVNNQQCTAATGYDGPSGVGTPQGLAIFKVGPAPTVAIRRPSVLKLKVKQTFSAVNFTDPSGGPAVGYSWRWGDGAVTTTTTAAASHVYTAAGARTVTLLVKDSLGRTATATSNIVMGVSPAARMVGPTSLRRLAAGHFTATRSSDANTGGSLISYTWRWGDNSISHGASAAHSYKRNGTFIVTLTVVDNAGLRGTRTLRVAVHS